MSASESLDEQIGGSGLDARGVTVAGLQRAMSAGSLTSAGLTAFYLGRIERLNPELHAVITVSPEALAEARASDLARSARRARGPLEGVPVLVKDNVAAQGMPTTAGSPALAGVQSPDAFAVARVRAAGAVILGKANLSEWANIRSIHSSSGWSTLGGQTANPHGAGRNPSGSSSGSAAAVAAGLAPLSIGTETDGSVVRKSRRSVRWSGSSATRARGPARRREGRRRLSGVAWRPEACVGPYARQRPCEPVAWARGRRVAGLLARWRFTTCQ
jgi:hypothetical protein